MADSSSDITRLPGEAWTEDTPYGPITYQQPDDDHPLGEKERVALRAAWPAPFTLFAALKDDDHFWCCVEKVAAGEDAERLAVPYARRHVRGRAMIARLLRLASWGSHQEARLLMEAGTVAVFADAPVDSADSRRALKGSAVERFRRGARVIVWRGAGRCSACGSGLDATRWCPDGWPRWVDYCAGCDAGAEPHRDRPAVEEVLNEAAAAVLHVQSSAAARRAVRAGAQRRPSKPSA